MGGLRATVIGRRYRAASCSTAWNGSDGTASDSPVVSTVTALPLESAADKILMPAGNGGAMVNPPGGILIEPPTVTRME